MSKEHYQSLPVQSANYIPLSPLSIIHRTANIFGDRVAVRYGKRQYSWREVYLRSIRLASALAKRGIGLGDTVSVIAPNLPELVEMHFGIPMIGAVINTISIRLQKQEVSYILNHSDCKLLLVDKEFVALAQDAMQLMDLKIPIIYIEDDSVDGAGSQQQNHYPNLPDHTDYESFLQTGTETFKWSMPKDEWQALSLNYTSGTSGNPKGVVYHHRGSYLMSMGTVPAWQLPLHPVYLYTVPMFHCNGWGHIWTMCLMAGTLICCRNVNARFVFDTVADNRVTHLGGAPIVLGMLVNADPSEKRTFLHHVKIMTAGAPPPPTILREIEKLGFEVMQVYGLTETYGHIIHCLCIHCLWQKEWDGLDEDEKVEIKSWQGISLPMTEDVQLLDLENGDLIDPGPSDLNIDDQQSRAGEIVIRGNTVMKGYYKDMEATSKAFQDGWFHSGDVAIWKAKGSSHYLQIMDRLKDVIISGGENISSIEIEKVLYQNPSVAHAAVVGKKDEKWGEVPWGFIELKPNAQVTEEELVQFCRERLAGFKTPKKIVFRNLPKAATGKIQKFLLKNEN